MKNKYKRIVIKIGTNVITKDNGFLDLDILENIIRQVSNLKKDNVEVIIVSSGAMGSGRGLIKISDKTNDIVKRQILASIGQPKLINTYSEIFNKYGYICAQILATKEDFRDRNHYLNMKNCLSALFHENIIPIVNENDVVSITELMFTDNDELAGLIASMLNAEALIILTNVNGIYNGNPNNKDSKVIEEVDINTDFESFISPDKSLFGRGGMLTKSGIGIKMSKLGITTYIANGKKENTITDIYENKNNVGTKFIPFKKASSVKKWIAHSEGNEKGTIYINNGAEIAICSKTKANSILPVGVINIEGEFKKGDIVKICNQDKKILGFGISQYNSEKSKIVIGMKGQKPLIHYDYLFLKA